ncbi:2-amino-3-carboxymuconate-6-semialdehyde decarboxylase protein [Mycena indigotica]|uniref:2-amino-3-carboxymuconate-6-semialdehyde decarboxylase protein n=1 Tax=Mycena indigotica TaxID=2126181 RepID=A0A8H6VTF5_9AGAR|nr:2-amino-3-carboxymuconate-6-semialdehyde decarboxylase protein [Mycena indigotica]KAF7291316.1 2-amino-3-carboxymuconate-6-semialdehyde decarboxylase protein [Mycena indigotica]
MSISDLAPETLQLIFGETLFQCPVPSLRQAPLLLAQICHIWREVTIDTPSLWATCCFGAPPVRSSVGQRRRSASWGIKNIQLLELWLSRVGKQTLRYEVYISPHREDVALEVVSLLLQHVQQWGDIALDFPAIVLPESMLTQSDHVFTNLTKLTLNNASVAAGFNSPNQSLQSTGSWLTPEQSFPVLRHLNLPYMPRPALGPLGFPWSQLSSLQCSGWTADDGVVVLLPCVSLQKFTYRWSIPGSSPRAMPVHRLPLLRYLQLTNQALLAVLSLPALTHLHLQGVVRQGPDPFDVVRELVSRSSCGDTLESLTLNEEAAGGIPDTLYQLLQQLPALTYLSLNFDRGLPLGLPTMVPILSDPGCLAHLRTFVFRAWMDDDPDALPSLLEAFKKRVQVTNSALEKVALTVQARPSVVTPPASPPDHYPAAQSAEYLARHLQLVSPLIVEEFRTLALNAGLRLRLVAARPTDGFRDGNGQFVNREEDMDILVDTGMTGEALYRCACTFCLSDVDA